ncbi:MAG TPA: hypothetical protein VIN75_00180 [Burkholderiaceae bacterium]
MSDTNPRVVPVAVNVSIETSGVKITCSPEPVPVAKGLDDVLITFTLGGAAGFSFPVDDAIVADKNSKSDFPYKSWTISNTLAALYDRNNKAAKVKYTVNVVDAQGTPYSLDPEIQNGGSAGTTCGDDDGDDDC